MAQGPILQIFLAHIRLFDNLSALCDWAQVKDVYQWGAVLACNNLLILLGRPYMTSQKFICFLHPRHTLIPLFIAKA
jgi:hypothetical protein